MQKQFDVVWPNNNHPQASTRWPTADLQLSSLQLSSFQLPWTTTSTSSSYRHYEIHLETVLLYDAERAFGKWRSTRQIRDERHFVNICSLEFEIYKKLLAARRGCEYCWESQWEKSGPESSSDFREAIKRSPSRQQSIKFVLNRSVIRHRIWMLNLLDTKTLKTHVLACLLNGY